MPADNTTPTPEQQEALKKRAHAVAERIARHVPVSKMERLAEKIEDPGFRNSIMFKSFIGSL